MFACLHVSILSSRLPLDRHHNALQYIERCTIYSLSSCAHRGAMLRNLDHSLSKLVNMACLASAPTIRASVAEQSAAQPDSNAHLSFFKVTTYNFPRHRDHPVTSFHLLPASRSSRDSLHH